MLRKTSGIGWARHVARMGDEKLMNNLIEGKRLFARPRCRLEDSIKMDLKEMLRVDVD
jgi:hypothetical protein